MTEETKTDKSGAPGCGVYVRINHDPDMELWIKALREIALTITHRSGYTRNMHVVELMLEAEASQEAREKAAALIHLAKLNGLVALIRGTAADAQALEADGALLSTAAELAPARALLGDDAIIGLACDSAEDSERAVSGGADYITLGSAARTASHQSLSQITMKHPDLPCAALGTISNDTAHFYVLSGASFIDITAYTLGHPKGVMQGCVNMLHAIDLSLSAPKRFN